MNLLTVLNPCPIVNETMESGSFRGVNMKFWYCSPPFQLSFFLILCKGLLLNQLNLKIDDNTNKTTDFLNFLTQLYLCFFIPFNYFPHMLD
jgi:hypothetical protein